MKRPGTNRFCPTGFLLLAAALCCAPRVDAAVRMPDLPETTPRTSDPRSLLESRAPEPDLRAPGRTVWRTDLDGALLSAAAEYKKVVLLLTTPNCVYCTRLKALVLPLPDVQEQLAKHILVEVDISRNPDVGDMYGVSGVPTLFLLGANGVPEGRITGLPTRENLVSLLAGRGAGDAPQASDRALFDLLDGEPSESEWASLVAALGRAAIREDLRAEFVRRPPPAGVLVRLLASPSLAVRLGAAELLEERAGESFGFDPWAPATEPRTEEALSRWTAWVAGGDAPSNAPSSILSAEDVERHLRDLVAGQRERSLRATHLLVRGGIAILPVMREFLDRHPDLEPGARNRLREVRYAVLIPKRRGVDPAALAHRLVSGNPDVRMQALRDLARYGAPARPIIEEFLVDASSLARETAVEVLVAALDLAAVPILVERSREETDRNVQVSIMRGLAALGDPDGVPVMTGFLEHADEDLVLVALQCLARMKNRGVSARIEKCLADPRWRVRATALETVAKLQLKELADAVEARLDDEEPFVQFKAVEAVTQAQGKRSVEKLERLFLGNDELKPPVLKSLLSMDVTLPPSIPTALRDAEPAVILQVLQVITDSYKDHTKLLEPLAAHPDLDVACAALRALSKRATLNAGARATVLAALREGPRPKQLAVLQHLEATSRSSSYYSSWDELDALAMDASNDAGEGEEGETASSSSLIADLISSFETPSSAPAPAAGEATPAAPAPVTAPGLGDLFDAFGITAATDSASPQSGRKTESIKDLTEALRGLLADADEEIAFEAELALVRLGEVTPLDGLLPKLEGLAASERARLAQPAATADSPAGRALAKALLRDASDSVRRAMAGAIADQLAKEAWADLLFEELLREGGALQPAEMYEWSIERNLQKQPARRHALRWINRMLEEQTRPTLKRFGLVLLESTGRKEDAPRLLELAKDSDPWTRRAAWHALAALDPTAFFQQAGRIAQDPSDEVRIVLPATFARNAEWVHRLDESTSLRSYSSSGGADDLRRRAGAAAWSNSIALLKEMAASASPRVAVEAGIALFSRGVPLDPAALAAAVDSMGDARAAGERVAAILRESYRQLGREYAVLLPYLRQSRVTGDQRRQITAHFDKQERLPDAALALRRVEDAPEHVDGAAEEVVSLPPGGRVRIVVFSERGCPDCERAAAYIRELRESFPEVEVERHDIASAAARALNRQLCEQFDAPDEFLFATPAIFSGGGYLIRDDVAFDRLVDLVARSMGVPLDAWYPASPEAAPVATMEEGTAPASEPYRVRWGYLLIPLAALFLVVWVYGDRWRNR